MLGTIKSSRQELLAAMEGKAPRDLVKRFTLIKDLSKLKALVKNVRVLDKVTDTGRVKHLVAKYKAEDNDKLSSLLQQSAELRKHLDPARAQRQILTVRFTAYDKRSYYAGKRLAKACSMMGLDYSGPVGLPQKTKRWTVLKSPFKYKKHQESWEQRIIRSIVTIDTANHGHLVPNLLNYIAKTCYSGVDVKIRSRRFIAPEQIYTDPYLKERIGLPPVASDTSYSDSQLDQNILDETLAIPAKEKKVKLTQTIVQL